MALFCRIGSEFKKHCNNSSFKNVKGTSQYCHNMMLDVIAKVRKFGPCTFFLTCCAAEFKWTKMLQVVAAQYGELSADQIQNLT